MMGTSSKIRTKEVSVNTDTVSPETSFPSEFPWQLLTHLAEYRIMVLVKEVMIFPNGTAYYVCPRCTVTLEREFMAYCDRCGQHLGWKGYKKAKIIYPGNQKKAHTKVKSARLE